MFSPEVFQARDSQGVLRTWFVVVMRTSEEGGSESQGEVWVLVLDLTALRVDGGTPEQPRWPGDPEITAGGSEIFVYYSNSPTLELWRSRTGIPVP